MSDTTALEYLMASMAELNRALAQLKGEHNGDDERKNQDSDVKRPRKTSAWRDQTSVGMDRTKSD